MGKTNLYFDQSGSDPSILDLTGISLVPAGEYRGNTLIRIIVLPFNRLQIEDEAFAGCTSLERITVPDGYEEDETVYHTVNNSGEVNIRLVKEG